MSRRVVNAGLVVALAATLLLHWYVRRPAAYPNVEFAQTMAQDAGFGPFEPNANFADGTTRRPPVAGTIARGLPPLGFGPSVVEGIRAGNELLNPISTADSEALERGRIVYRRYCELCHAPDGKGSGPISRHGFPAPTLHREAARQMKDGQMFHIVTFGRGAMPGHGSQIPVNDRWKVVLHVRVLQQREGAVGSEPATGSE